MGNYDIAASIRMFVDTADDGHSALVVYCIFQPGITAGYRDIWIYLQPVFSSKPFFCDSDPSLVVSVIIQSAYPWSYAVDRNLTWNRGIAVGSGSSPVCQERI